MEILFVGVFVRFFYGNSAPVAGLERFAGLALQFSAARVPPLLRGFLCGLRLGDFSPSLARLGLDHFRDIVNAYEHG